eukprot:gene55703-44168_t
MRRGEWHDCVVMSDCPGGSFVVRLVGDQFSSLRPFRRSRRQLTAKVDRALVHAARRSDEDGRRRGCLDGFLGGFRATDNEDEHMAPAEEPLHAALRDPLPLLSSNERVDPDLCRATFVLQTEVPDPRYRD